jgi:hypothetical protein
LSCLFILNPHFSHTYDAPFGALTIPHLEHLLVEFFGLRIMTLDLYPINVMIVF